MSCLHDFALSIPTWSAKGAKELVLVGASYLKAESKTI
jgi:hypothetical protein